MKKSILFITFICITSFLFSQSIQLDIPVEEIVQQSTNRDSKSMFFKSPYLIFEGVNTQMRVIWQLEETTECEIFWGEDISYSLGSAITAEYGDDHQHGHSIDNLIPGTKYFYKVLYSDVIHEGSFMTAPDAESTDLKFFVYGDTRSDMANHNNLSAAIIEDYIDDPEFQTISLFTGDHVTYGAVESNWQSSFFSPDAPNIRQRMAELPFISCLGNHELYKYQYLGLDLETQVYGKYFPYPFVERRYWSFDYGPIHVCVLDQYPDYYTLMGMEGYIDDMQLEWIEQDLSATDKPWKIIVLHEPGWSCEGSSSGYSHPNNPDVQGLLQPLLEQYGVQILFSAHNHYYARACKNGVYHITTAGGGAPLYEIEDDFPNVIHTHQVHHYCKVIIEGETMTVTAITADGEVIDEFMVDQNDRPDHLLGFLRKEEGPGEVMDILISASEQTTTADEIGYYGLELFPGAHDVSFELFNYYTIDTSSQIFEGTETELDTLMRLISGTNHINDSCPITVSPNPINHQAILRYDLKDTGEIEVNILDINGICLKSWHYKQKSGHKEVKLDLKDLPTGIYFCQVKLENNLISKKIIKLQ